MSQSEAIEKSISALALQPEHAALIEAARGLAEAVDGAPANASLWGQYREAIAALLIAVPEAEEDDGQAALLELVRPEIRNAKKPKAKNTRAGAGSNRRAARNATDAVAATGRRRGTGAPA